ncbi:alpha-L-rhamnosidase [Novipirellula artificiosorum]|uniref:alpha-L-rhamnosidase n=2 Tax=Novipirellula artificiosorum TaxID=2528016 RepID=A0A5C6DKR3_9BACT|nr:alpha-L-rhamnosidase [Novipirellula artificiosorum]TWU37182.1 Bacterial alpha-L-rhamnosidase [Novipirellula artificiosorum]
MRYLTAICTLLQHGLLGCGLLTAMLTPSLTLAEEGSDSEGTLHPTHLRCEYRANPLGVDETKPRLMWQVASEHRAATQTAYQILVASSDEKLSQNIGDRWDSKQVNSNQTLHIEYDGKPLASRQPCYWKVRVWDENGNPSAWSDPAHWTMGLLDDSDWSGQYISYLDDTPIHDDRETLFLPAARQYRKEFRSEKRVRRATIYSTALGIYELHLNGQRVSDAYFTPGWTDYRQRAYYNTFDVTDMVREGDNALGSWVADGWYSGYVGFGLLTGMGTEKIGRYTYGKTPAWMGQLEIEYADGTTETIATDSSWKVTGDGPITEADLLMGEAYDARREQAGWTLAGFDDGPWDQAIHASENGSPVATFYQAENPLESGKNPTIEGNDRNLGFNRPRLESFPGVLVRVIEEIPAVEVIEREPGVFMVNLGQNFAGAIRLKVKGKAGQRIKIRYGEMLYPDGRLMTENLRKARCQDFYTCKGAPEGETFQPRFTFHGFQFVQLSNFPGEADLETVTGLAMHSDTPLVSTFECSDPMVNQLFRNVVWTQRANFLDLPTDCPQRDERMGWTGDAQAYVATAAYNADIGAFYTKWLRELMESQRPSGAFPGYAPFPFQHGWDFGSAWADAGVICPWTIWQAYGDTRVIDRCWEPMTRFMQWRKGTSQGELGIAHGNAWGDWLAQGATTPLEYVDTVYFAISAKMMSEMAEATGRHEEAEAYHQQFQRTKAVFGETYLEDDGSISVNTQTAHALALFADLVPEPMREATAKRLAEKIALNGNHMSTGFLGTRPLLPVLSSAGQHDLATFLLQSHEFPSWGYEIDNGATTIWERWDSYTKEDAFGRHNAAMNSFSHYSFGAVCEWMFRTLAGIDSAAPGYETIVIRPTPPSPGSNAQHPAIDWTSASYDSIRGKIQSNWAVDGDTFTLETTIPANTKAWVHLPGSGLENVTESGKPVHQVDGVRFVRNEADRIVLEIQSGTYKFVSKQAIGSATSALQTSQPADMTINPDQIDLTDATPLASWNFSKAEDVQRWTGQHNLKIQIGDDHAVVQSEGKDPQLSTTLDSAVEGKIVVEIKAMVSKGTEMDLFWASPNGNFNGTQHVGRSLAGSDQFHSYLYRIGDGTPLQKLRIDPFANLGTIKIDSITLYQLSR